LIEGKKEGKEGKRHGLGILNIFGKNFASAREKKVLLLARRDRNRARDLSTARGD